MNGSSLFALSLPQLYHLNSGALMTMMSGFQTAHTKHYNISLPRTDLALLPGRLACPKDFRLTVVENGKPSCLYCDSYIRFMSQCQLDVAE